MTAQKWLFSVTDLDRGVSVRLDSDHYLGASGARGRHVYQDAVGVIVFASPSSRRLPTDWIELSRWCLASEAKNAGSAQWARAVAWLRERLPECSTVVSYSDPSVGHDGALYRASNWLWAPTWHVLRPPPTGAGMRGGKRQAAKHRWVYLLRPDERRESALSMKDESLARRFPWASYVEPEWRRGVPVVGDRPAAWRRWASAAKVTP